MKKRLLLLTVLALGLTAHAEPALADDEQKNENSGGIKLTNGMDENDRWSLHVYAGIDIPTGAPDGVSFAPFRSWEINVTMVQYDYTPKNWKTSFSAGLGFNWRNYTLSGHDKMFGKMAAGTLGNKEEFIVVGKPDDEWDDLSSNIRTTSLSMPLLVKHRFSKGFALSAGAQLNWNFYSRIHNSYEQGDNDIDVYTKKIGHRPFTIDVMGIIHLGDLGFYCKYSPMSVLKKDRGPEFKSLAVGIYF